MEIDETFVGGKHPERGKGPHERKVMVLGAVQRGGEVRLRVQGGEDRKTRAAYHRFVAGTVADETSEIHTDAARAWGDLSDHDTRHEKVSHVKRNGSAPTSTRTPSRASGPS